MRILLLFAILLPFSLSAQSLPVFRVNTDVVTVPVTVTDRSGRFVPGLTVDQFLISDGGIDRPIAQFSTERVPVSLGILLDISGSMATDAKTRALDDARWADTRRALELLVERLDPRDEVLFAAFSDKVGLAVPWTRDHQRVPARVQCLAAWWLYGALRCGEVDRARISARGTRAQGVARHLRRPGQPGAAHQWWSRSRVQAKDARGASPDRD